MKAEGRLFVRGHDGKPHGPVRWTAVREWVAIGYFKPDDQVRWADEEGWRPIRSEGDLLTLPPGADKDDALNVIRARAKEQKPVGPRAAAYLGRLECPVALARLNPYTAFHWVRMLEELHPDRADQTEHWAAEEEAAGRVPAATPEHATEEQRQRLRARGIPVPEGLTRLQARRLFSGPPTEEQLERLKFCGLSLPEGACEEEAAEVISRQMKDNWASEESFQAYRQSGKSEARAAAPAKLKLRDGPRLSPLPTEPEISAPDPFAGHPRVEPPRRARGPLYVGLIAVGALVAFAVVKMTMKKEAPAAADDATSPMGANTSGPTVTVLESPSAAQGEVLKRWMAALELTGFVGGEEPRVLIAGHLRRVGDVLDATRGIVVVQIDEKKKTLVVTDAAGAIVQRVHK